ncbi:helix-turn-helix domain-containing protein [Brevibacillus sp. BC25]|uniref:helix-turn-helix domain-containing protein n=1 Tax=Brevibacillus sp. BC25 TaxID=1144308 RepID=UPI0002713FF3|nr:helix-turn-helix domain-containing protein [Brevibacillus sp. BC25]EJL24696.1 transposase [Brevibacillus sp. BC25]
MGNIQKTYDVAFKKKAVDFYIKTGMGYRRCGKELGIDPTMLRRWVNHFQKEGIAGLEEKRGKVRGIGVGRPKIRPEDPEVKIKRLEAENALLKKLLKM